MANFFYIGFAFNRVSLIGKDHPKLVEKMSKLSMNKYIIVSGIISIALSVVKGFRYQINYDHPELNYPFLIEHDLKVDRGWTRDVYFVFNFISDMLNYVIFVVANISIDAYMVVRLRKTLGEKLDRFKSNQQKNVDKSKKSESKNKKETDITEAINNAIRMVVINSTLNLFFKLPLVIIPLQNVIVAFYYKSKSYETTVNHPLDSYMGHMSEMDLVTLVNESSDWLFSILLAIQFFVNLEFDKKIKEAFEKTFPKKTPKNKPSVFSHLVLASKST